MQTKNSILLKIYKIILFLFGYIILQSGIIKPSDYDIVVYGGTSAGITAAIQASRMGKTVILIEPSDRIGGLTTNGLGQTDIGNKQAIGGIAREFYRNVKKHYQNEDSNEDAMWTFEPSVALSIFQEWNLYL
jgi:predicted flavoprotein YhiN